MYAKLLAALGDGGARWKSFFATSPQAEWISGTRVRPASPSLAETGLAVRDGRDTVVGPPISVVPRGISDHNGATPSPAQLHQLGRVGRVPDR